jgi:diguanylate cyclase (GGDEF)-like protein/PAS domain S-box-containing protein
MYMSEYHPLLARQLNRLGLTSAANSLRIAKLLSIVGETYAQFESDIELHEHIMEVTSQELIDANLGMRALHELLVESSANGIFAFDNNLVITTWNASMERLTNIKSEEALGKSVGNCFPLLETNDFARALQGASVRKEDCSSWLQVVPGVTSLDIHIDPLFMRSHEIIGGFCMLIDTTKRKQEEMEREKQRQFFATLQETALSLRNHVEFDALLRNALTRIAATLETDNVAIALLDSAKSDYRITHALGTLVSYLDLPLTIKGPLREPSEDGELTVSIAGEQHLPLNTVAIINNGHIYGFICTKKSEHMQIMAANHSIMKQLANLIGIALNQNALREANLQLALLAHHDPLTKLPNHRRLIDLLDQTLNMCGSQDVPCSLLFIDIDHFKHINDTWGHQAGDAILVESSRRMCAALPEEGILGRYGGEEFVAVLPNCEIVQAQAIAESVRRSLADTPYRWSDLTETIVDIPITASLGVALWEPLMARDQLIMHADYAMYRAKRTGRNMVCVAGIDDERVFNEDSSNLLQSAIVKMLMLLARERDKGLSDHSQRLLHYTLAIGRTLQLSAEELEQFRVAALLHDIGKLVIPDTILHKPSALTQDEWQVVRRHPEIGKLLLGEAGADFEPIAQIIFSHHERWDGTGYPSGLVGEAIPLGARILAIVDAFDVMLSTRAYKDPITWEQAIAELANCSGTQFDPHLVDIMISLVQQEMEMEKAA